METILRLEKGHLKFVPHDKQLDTALLQCHRQGGRYMEYGIWNMEYRSIYFDPFDLYSIRIILTSFDPFDPFVPI